MGRVLVSPYVPPKYLVNTEFPEAFGRDVATQIQLIEEKWRRFFPLIPYYSLEQNTGIASTPDNITPEIPAPVTSTGAGAGYDTLWGEEVDRAAATAGEWSQPHLSGSQAATTENEVYAGPVNLHLDIKEVANKKRVKELWGFDDVRDVVAVVPLSLLDRCSIGVKEGDKIVWDGAEYTVLEFRGSGWWKKSNVRFYGAFNFEHKRLGS
jgi:hypothetical protein